MSKKSFIDSVKVGTPCGESWEKMEGNSQVRFCSHCSKNVSDLSSMTRKQALKFVRTNSNNLCVRYVTTPGTTTPLFADALVRITRKAPGIAVGVMSASIAISSNAFAQSAPNPDSAWPSSMPTTTPSPKATAPHPEKASPRPIRVNGVVLDPNGAVIPGAQLILVENDSAKRYETASDQNGDFEFPAVTVGRYTLTASSPGFRSATRSLDINESDPSAADQTIRIGLTLAAGFAVAGDVSVVEYSSPLSVAVADEDLKAVKDLLRKGAKVNAKEQDYGKITPLFVAVEHGNVDIVRLLLAYGAKVNARNESKQTAMWRLDDDATPELVSVLLKEGAKLDIVDDEGSTPLVQVAGFVKPEVLQALLDGGADVNHADAEGTTGLMTAVEYGATENVRLLLSAGANVNARDKDGKTALDRANDDDVKQLLMTYGAVGQPEEKEEKSEDEVVDD